MLEHDPQEVQITLEDGQVLDFLTSEGDKITMHNVRTEQKGDDDVKIHYIKLLIVAKEDRHEDS